MARIEEEYMDVLQNIEMAIAMYYREHPDLSDHDVSRTLEALSDIYRAENVGREPRDFGLSELEEGLLASVKGMTDWRLGRVEIEAIDEEVGEETDEETVAPAMEPKTTDEIVKCLKRLIKSVQTWNRRGGPRGYLNFVTQFV